MNDYCYVIAHLELESRETMHRPVLVPRIQHVGFFSEWPVTTVDRSVQALLHKTSGHSYEEARRRAFEDLSLYARNSPTWAAIFEMSKAAYAQ